MKHIIIIGLTLALSSCGFLNNIPEMNKLNDRIMLFYAAEQNGDWDKWDSFLNPTFKHRNGEKQNSNPVMEARDFKIVTYTISKIKRVENYGPAEENVPTVAVSMDVVVNRNGKYKKEENQTDYWAFIDGEWYWTWRGWPND